MASVTSRVDDHSGEMSMSLGDRVNEAAERLGSDMATMIDKLHENERFDWKFERLDGKTCVTVEGLEWWISAQG